MSGPVHVGDEGIEPDGARGYVRRRIVSRGRIEHYRSGQIIESEIEADTGAQQIANFLIRLVAPKRFIHVHQHQFRHLQA